MKSLEYSEYSVKGVPENPEKIDLASAHD